MREILFKAKKGKGYPVIVTHWMPLPNSPKKEQK